MIDLSGKTALVTGSSRGIGRAAAICLAEAGANVAVNYVASRSEAEHTAGEIRSYGVETAIVKADVGELEDVQAMIDFVGKTFGRLDVMVSNAATGGFRSLTATTAQHFESAMRTNVQALMFLVQTALPLLETGTGPGTGRSKVISLSSAGSERALPQYGVIGSTKAALESLTRHFALELGNRGINFNVVRAGLVETDSFQMMPNRDRIREAARARSLVNCQLLTPDAVADAVLFLASPLSDHIQGQTITVDSGHEILG
jgi:enoyl-[acyl-carrier protein] reductase III